MSQKVTLEQLNNKELEVVRLKYLGKKSGEIAEATGYTEQYVRKLIARHGRLSDAYEEYETKENQRKRNRASRLLTQNVDNAVIVIASLLVDVDPNVKLRAAREILDRVLGKPVQVALQGDMDQSFIDQLKKDLGFDEDSLTEADFTPDVWKLDYQ